MSLDAARLALPKQPRPPQHWPQDCIEVMSHEWLRVFRCPLPDCGKVIELQRDEMDKDDGVACYGDGWTTVQEDVRC